MNKRVQWKGFNEEYGWEGSEESLDGKVQWRVYDETDDKYL